MYMLSENKQNDRWVKKTAIREVKSKGGRTRDDLDLGGPRSQGLIAGVQPPAARSLPGASSQHDL